MKKYLLTLFFFIIMQNFSLAQDFQTDSTKKIFNSKKVSNYSLDVNLSGGVSIPVNQGEYIALNGFNFNPSASYSTRGYGINVSYNFLSNPFKSLDFNKYETNTSIAKSTNKENFINQFIGIGPIIDIHQNKWRFNTFFNIGLFSSNQPDLLYTTNLIDTTFTLFESNSESVSKLGFSTGIKLSHKLSNRFNIFISGDYLGTFSNISKIYKTRDIIDYNSNGRFDEDEIIESEIITTEVENKNRFVSFELGISYLIKKPDRIIMNKPIDLPRPTLDETENISNPCECGFEVFRNVEDNYQLRFHVTCLSSKMPNFSFVPSLVRYHSYNNGNYINSQTINLTSSPDISIGTAGIRKYMNGSLPVILGPNKITYKLEIDANFYPGRSKICECEKEFEGFPIPNIRFNEKQTNFKLKKQ